MKSADLLQNANTKTGGHIFGEINGQPVLWRKTYSAVYEKRDQLTAFLNRVFEVSGLQIVLSGAGSSAFIGEILQQSF